MRRSAEFADTIRKGSRSVGRHLVVHVARAVGAPSAEPTPAEPARVGFVVSRAVGGAVRRNRVQRRLRAILARAELGEGTLVVVRARPSAAEASFEELRREARRLLQRALVKDAQRAAQHGERVGA